MRIIIYPHLWSTFTIEPAPSGSFYLINFIMKKSLHLSFSLMCNRPPGGNRFKNVVKSTFFDLWLLLLLSAGLPVMAQNSAPITGRVTDATNQPLPGVTVKTKESGIATITDADGRYKITAPNTATLVFSYVGFVTQEIRIADQTVIDVQLRDDARSLNEVVVIGYQTIRRRDLTGAVSTVNPTEAARVASNNVGESLQGLTPGVTVRNSGAPGQQSQIEIRGVASFRSSDPLFVIDGMITEGGGNSNINSDDIESIQILKDASAAAIYGSRAANGVVIITTKRGRKGPPTINFSARYGTQNIPKQWDMMNNTEYAATKRQAYTNSNIAIPPSLGSAFDASVNTDWQDLAQRTGITQNYNVSINGGSDNSTYLVSASYFDNKGALQANSFNRASLRINTETKKGRLTFGENAVITNSNTYRPNRGNAFFDMPQLLPTLPVQGSQFVTPNSTLNPMGYSTGSIDNVDVTYALNTIAINELSQYSTNTAQLVGNAFAQLRLFDWLDYKFNVGLEAAFDVNRDLRKNGIFSYGQQPELSYIDDDRQRYRNILIEHTLNFNKSFNVHNINGVIGYTEQTFYRDRNDARKTNLPIYNGEYLTQVSAAGGTSSASGSVVRDDRIRSYLGRVNYTYNDKYLLTASGRIDQDSRFGPDYRTGFFPSVAASWRISKESFFKASWVDNLKINASYGLLGINTINSYESQGFINTAPRAVLSADQIFNGAYLARLYNEDIRWEKRYATNLGVDATFLNNRLSVSVAYYNNKSKDVLINLPLVLPLGNAGTFPAVNAGSISNKGIELSASYRNNDHPFKWSLAGNITTIKNKVLEVSSQNGGINYIQQGSTRSQVGYSLGQWYVLDDLSIFQTQEEINNYKRNDGTLIQPLAKPGDIKFGANPNSTGPINNNDRIFKGSPWPTLQTGLQFNSTYKQFSINIQMVGVFGLTLYNDVRRILDGYQNTNFRRDINPWSPTNTGASDPRLGIAVGDPGIASNNTPESSRWLENGSYGRIRNLELGYTLPKTALTRFHIDNARVFISGQNLLTITKYTGLDPDVVGNRDPNVTGSTIQQRGVDAGNWPSNRIFTLGVNVGF
jgi:TonB-linked SusC/RagA family outer membrane protein